MNSIFLFTEGGNEGEIWRNKLWSKSAEEPPNPIPIDQRPQSAAWGKGSCKSAGIPPVTEVYKERPKSKKRWSIRSTWNSW